MKNRDQEAAYKWVSLEHLDEMFPDSQAWTRVETDWETHRPHTQAKDVKCTMAHWRGPAQQVGVGLLIPKRLSVL